MSGATKKSVYNSKGFKLLSKLNVNDANQAAGLVINKIGETNPRHWDIVFWIFRYSEEYDARYLCGEEKPQKDSHLLPSKGTPTWDVSCIEIVKK